MGLPATSTPASRGGARVAEGAPSPALAPPPGNPRFPLFDGLRGFAVLGILDYHVTTYTGLLGVGIAGRFAEVAGTQAVIAFFAISGFLLYRPYVAARANGRPVPSTGRYARRRALRILPAYWTALTVLAIYPGIEVIFSSTWWRYYGYLQLYSRRTLLNGIPVAWTLCVEVTFYILLPVWGHAVRRLAPRARGRGIVWPELLPLAAIALGGAVVQVLATRRHWGSPLGDSLLGQCTWICIGMAFAVLSVAAEQSDGLAAWLRRIAGFPELCWLGAAGAFAGLMAMVPSQGLFGLVAAVNTGVSAASTSAKIVLEAVLVVLLMVPVVFAGERPGLPRRFLAFRPLVLLGVISYSFYLYHLTIIQLLALPGAPGGFRASGLDLLGHVHTLPSLVLYVAALAVTAAVATVSYRLVELPFLRRKERRA